MANKQLRLLSVILLMLSWGNKVQAQVTIGSDIPAEKYALLQVKEIQPQVGDEGGATVMSGGILLPRVKLTNLNNLSDLSIDNPTLDATKKEHVGLMVFNVNITESVPAGLYVWDGQQWLFLILDITE